MLDGEYDWLTAVVTNLADDNVKLVYADWLQEHGDPDRAAFLRKFVEASRSMKAEDLPKPWEFCSEEWVELIGFRLLEKIMCAGFPELKEPVLRLARPAVRVVRRETADYRLPSATSKFGGDPDLPRGYPWPKGEECRAIFCDPGTAGVQQLAGFLGQINFAELTHTQATRDLPQEGLLSFFAFRDPSNDHLGVKANFFPDPTGFTPTSAPGPLVEGNRYMPALRLVFEETLDLPCLGSYSRGPWAGEVPSEPGADEIFDHFRELNFDNLLGYGRSTTGGDPTPSKEYRHLLMLENSLGLRLHIQIHENDLVALDFDKIKLVWVD